MEEKHIIMGDLQQIRRDVGTIKNMMIFVALVVAVSVIVSICSVLGTVPY